MYAEHPVIQAESRRSVRKNMRIGTVVAASDVRDRVGSERCRLPVGVQGPAIAKVDAVVQAIRLAFSRRRAACP